MATGARSTNTMSEMLTDMLRNISVSKTLPDADLEFLVNLETVILTKLRAPLEAASGQLPGMAPPGGAPAGAPAPGMEGMPAGPPPGMEQMMPMAPPMDTPIPPPPQDVPGGPGSRPVIPPDGLARLLAGSA